MHGLKRLLAALLPIGLPLPILSGPLRGRKWITGAAPGPAKGLSVLINRCETGQLAEAERLVTGTSVCFDVGAHAGMYSLLFGLKGKTVFAFEPLPRNIAFLTRTLALNVLCNVRIIPWALAGKTGPSRFREGSHNSEGTLDAKGDMMVFTITCDTFCQTYATHPDVIKIDVEGAEIEVLKGAESTLKTFHPALLLSTHGDGPKKDCFEFLRGLGYQSFKPLDAEVVEKANEFSITV